MVVSLAWRGRAERALAPGLLILLPILVKSPLLLGIGRPDPLLLYSGLGIGVAPGRLSAFHPTIDPNMGFTSQALGARAALDLLAGHMPWWNPFEGVGAPLAGEMQSAALFPPTLLLLLPNGQVLEHILFQVAAGLATYALLRQLGLRRVACFAGAAVFAFNGAFAWLANAVVNPIAFLPLLLLGIERAGLRARQGRPGGGLWISVALAGSLYAGFPEVAYLDGLLGLVWALARAATLGRRALAFLGKVAAAGLAGVLVSAPLLIAFADYLPLAEVGIHAGSGPFYPHLDPRYLPLVAMPYWLGGIFANWDDGAFWGNVGGYAGCALLILGLAGVAGRRHLPLRLLLAAWVIVALAITFGAPWLAWLVQIVPGLRQAALYRYLPPSWILCLCALAALAIDDLMAGLRRWPLAVAALLVSATCAALIRVSFLPIPPGRFGVFTTLAAGAGLLLPAVLALWPRLGARWRGAGLAALVAGEAILWFALPTLSYPRHGSVEMAGIGFLRSHLGLQRVMALGGLAPNYGSYFGLATVNHNDLPIPRAWTDYVHDHLDANALAIVFDGINRMDPNGPTPAGESRRNRDAYAAIGVRYIVTPLDGERPDLPEVFHDSAIRIFELPGAAPYVTAPGCRLTARDRVDIAASCAAPATLVRLELDMPGWRASLNGRPAGITRVAGIFQSVAVPAGTSEVRFAFEPPYLRLGEIALGIGLLMLLIPPAIRAWRRPQNPQATLRSLPRIRLR